MFEIRLFKPNADAEPRHGGAELLDAWRQSSDDVIWVDIAGPLSPTDQETLAAAFGLHRLALQDASRDRHPPKLEVFGDHSFLLFKGLSADSESIDCRTIQSAMFLGPRFLVTRHSDESPSIRRLSEEIDSRSSSIACSPGAFAARLARLMVDRYLGVLMALEPRLEEISAMISASERRAMAAERDTVDRLIAHHLATRIGDEFDGRIAGVNKAGLFVSLPQFGADGFVPASMIGADYFIHDESRHAMVAERSGKGYQLGDAVRVRLAEAQPLAGSMRFDILTEPRPLPGATRSYHKSRNRRPARRPRR